MDNKKDIRWKQRFQNFTKAFNHLKKTLDISNPSEAEKAGLIQFYEMTFELAWKMMRDYLQEEGYSISSPREAIKQSFQSGIIEDGHPWMEALEDQNLTTHTYDEATAEKVVTSIREDYFPIIEHLFQYMSARI